MSKINDNWFGNLTIENVEQVAKVVEKMLSGKLYSFAAHIEGRSGGVELRTDQQLEGGRGGKNVHWYRKNGSAGFNVCDTYGVWGVSTSAHDPSNYDGTFKTPYIEFEHGRTIKVTQLNGYGDVIHWTVQIQGRE